MTEKDLKKLSRADLLEMLIAQTRENEDLRDQIAELQEKLTSRDISIASAGSIAEASLKLNSVFESAQAAAEQYLDNIHRTEEVNSRMESEAQEKSRQMIEEAKKEAERIKTSAQTEADNYWTELTKRLDAFYAERKGLKELLELGQNL